MTANREYIKTDKSGTKYYRISERCWKCNGSGVYSWGVGYSGNLMYSGVCYACNGSGINTHVEKEYTPEKLAKLEKAKAKRLEARLAKLAEEERLRAEEAARQEAERQKVRETNARSNFVGEVGDKLEIKATLTNCITYEKSNYYGYGTVTAHIYKFIDSDGNILVWFTESGIDAKEGDRVTLKATVKKHSYYTEREDKKYDEISGEEIKQDGGTKQTILTRCKVKREEA